MEKVYQLYLADKLDKDGFGRRYQPLSDRQRTIEEELPKLQAELDVLRINHLSRDEVIAKARDLYTRWPNLGAEEKRQIVETITDRIVIGKDEVSINLLYLPAIGDAGDKATKPHGFIAATSWKRAG